jgi:hypothetical protein
MDEGTNGVDEAAAGGSEDEDGAESPEHAAERLEQRAGAIRDNLTGLVHELDQRRQGVAWRMIVKPLAVVAGIAIAIFAGRVWWRARGVRRFRRVVGLR